MVQIGSPSKINEEQTKQVNNKQYKKQSESQMSVQSLRHFEQTNSQYLNYCPTQQLLDRIEHKLTLLTYLFDLLQSIVSKQKQRYERVGFFPVNNNKSLANNKDSVNLNRDQSLNQINNQRLKSLILDNLFYQDLNKIQLLKSRIENQVKVITKHLHARIKRNQLMKTQLQEIYGKVKKNCYSASMAENPQQSKESSEKLITAKNHQLYISWLYQYLLIKFGDINLYDLLKQLTQRWICDVYQQQEQRCFNLLNQIEQENGSLQNVKLLSNEKSKTEETLKNNIAMTLNTQISIYRPRRQRKVQIEEENKKLAFLQLLHQTKIKIRETTLFESAVVPIDNFSRLCCNTFLYNFSSIQSNKYSSNPKNDNLIFITKQSLEQQHSQQSQKSFKTYQPAIKQAASALLNNNGGFIFVGFKKQGLQYRPQCPFLLSENSTKEIQLKIVETVSKQITLLTGKNEKQQMPYKNIYVDFIPIFKRRNDSAKQGNFANEGEFVWRIRVQPHYSSKHKIHSICDVFYDLDHKNETFLKLLDDEYDKDTIYNKLKGMLDYYEISKCEEQSILKFNPYRLILHNNACQKLLCQTHFAKQHREIDESQNKNQQPSDQNRKKNERSLPNTQAVTTEEIKKNIDSNQEQKVEFKQINLIVLQNKNIKENCEKYFYDKKIQIKIQKLESQTFKKLTKQTYIIQHHKKFDEINTQLGDFKKGFNSKKNISLISAEKSVSVDCSIDSSLLKEILRMAKKEIQKFDDQNICYVEETKDNQTKSYLKAESKKAGIYLYFILSELNLKAKMKNVPANLHNKLTLLEEAIKEKQSKEEKPNTKEATRNSNQQSSQANSNKGQKNVNKNNNNFNSQSYVNYQQQQFYQPYGYNQYPIQDPNYKLYQQSWLQYFISTFNNYVKMYGKQKAAEEFNNMLASNNNNEMYNFSYYQISSQPSFQSINTQLQRNYYYKSNYHNHFPQNHHQPY